MPRIKTPKAIAGIRSDIIQLSFLELKWWDAVNGADHITGSSYDSNANTAMASTELVAPSEIITSQRQEFTTLQMHFGLIGLKRLGRF